MKKAHRIRLNPTPEQQVYLNRAAGTARFAYNWMLARWNEIRDAGGSPSLYEIKKKFNALRRTEYSWSYEVTKCAVDSGFRNLQAAFRNFFTDCRKLERGEITKRRFGYPRFKKKGKARQSFRLDRDRFSVDGHWLKIQKLCEPINMAEELRFQGEQITATLSLEAGHWYVSITVEVDPPLSETYQRRSEAGQDLSVRPGAPECVRQARYDHPQESIGIDLGVKTLAVLSDGQEYENQVLLRSELRKLKRLNRELSRRQKGSKRWWKTKEKLQRFHARIKRQRQDYSHKMTTEIAQTYQWIGLEDLNVAGMMRNRRLALSLADAGFGEIKRQLKYKAEWYGGQVVLIDRFFPSSKTCSVCGCVNRTLALSDREWTCPDCGTVHDRDLNAAINIEAQMLRARAGARAVAAVASSRPKTHVDRT